MAVSVSVTANNKHHTGWCYPGEDTRNGKVISNGKSAVGQEVLLDVAQPKLWSPESPYLYDMEVSIIRKGIAIDLVKSYFGMRKYHQRDGTAFTGCNSIIRIIFSWPARSGMVARWIYTAPTDEALLFDIKKTKDFGFNMIRKHVKVEPARWYYHCDREGILVWQDMPSGDRSPQWQQRNYFNGQEFERSARSNKNYRNEWKEIMDLCYSNPCVVTWVPLTRPGASLKHGKLWNGQRTMIVTPCESGQWR